MWRVHTKCDKSRCYLLLGTTHKIRKNLKGIAAARMKRKKNVNEFFSVFMTEIRGFVPLPICFYWIQFSTFPLLFSLSVCILAHFPIGIISKFIHFGCLRCYFINLLQFQSVFVDDFLLKKLNFKALAISILAAPIYCLSWCRHQRIHDIFIELCRFTIKKL